MITVVLAESSLHFIPDRYHKDPSVSRLSKKRKKNPGSMLMDLSELRSLGFRGKVGEKEGRPDIVHRTLLSVTDSPLFLMGRVRLYVHTIEDRLFKVKEGVRPPRSYRRFVGLMEQLLSRGSVGPSEAPLIFEVNSNLSEVISGEVLLLHEEGDLIDPIGLISSIGRDYSIIVGAFPHGDFREEIASLASRRVTLFKGTLSSSAAISMMLAYAYYVEMWDAKTKGKGEENC